MTVPSTLLTQILLGSGGVLGNLTISFDTDPTPDARARLVLVVGTEEFAFKDADFRGANNSNLA